ncbi:MAG: hypothetical protein KY464_07085 [Gemmatimonadetes bacterium]|nr:hypothetical protein [Gemmatimonadota bacterium]
MQRRLKSLLICSLFSGVLLTSCEPGSSGVTETPNGPDLAQTIGSPQDQYTWVEVSSIPGQPRTAQVIGVAGGALELSGHTLTVPAGAVSEPTLFSMIVLPNGRIEIELLATTVEPFGQSRDVGSGGFQNGNTVRLTLSYARATNVDDPSRLVLLYLRDDGGVEKIPTTLDQATQTITAELQHFSRYCMAMD